jgi:DNA polymerase III subunit gamma/tau
MAWYNTYRPTSFDDVVGQTLTKEVLLGSLKKGSIKHAYLFSGPKGVGKTTLARIFANELNQVEFNPEAALDIIEMDAASNTGIDDVRRLIESAKSEPMSAQYKIYIIDEVHMLSKSAMNALLKILEEPADYVVFLLATTNPEKLIPTVLSRLTKLPLYNHTQEDIIARLKYIAENEQVLIDDAGLAIIAKHANGSQRDAINLLETIAAYGLDSYDESKISELLGLLSTQVIQNIADTLVSQQLNKSFFSTIQHVSIEPNQVLDQLMEYSIDCSINGNTNYEALIIPIAELMGLQLPFNSLTSALIILSQKLTPTSHLPITPISNITPAVTQPISPAPHEDLTPVQINEQPTTVVEKEPTSKTTEQLVITEPVESVVSIAKTPARTEPSTRHEIESQIHALKELSDCPPILKMIIPDLQVIAGDTAQSILLTVTNGIFLAQIQAHKMQQWILDKLEAQTNIRYQITASKREKSAETIASIQPSQPERQVETSYQNETNKEPKVETSPVNLTTKNTSNKIFYKVYKALPKEMNEGDLPVFAGELPTPPSSENWEEVEDMFELE